MPSWQKSGLISAVLAFTIWGLFPLYWKQLEGVDAFIIMCHRIWWSFMGMILLSFLLKINKVIYEDLKKLLQEPKKLLLVVMSAFVISANWLIFIWAVNDQRVLETSLGYYINPLLSVLLGVVALKEKLSLCQLVAVLLAASGVLNLTLHFGSLPWVSLLLALTMAVYGLFKKQVQLNAFTSLTLETLIVAPFALIYLIYVGRPENYFFTQLNGQTIFLLGGGIVTIIPLLLFANAANNLPLSTLGLVQYLTPTFTFLMGVFLYREPFTNVHLISFGLIWLGLLIFTCSNTSFLRKR